MGKVPQQQSASRKGFKAALADIRAGIHFIRHQPLILSSMILDFFATFFASANTLLPYFSQYVLHIGEVAYGWLAAAESIGSVMVGLIISQFNHVRRQGLLLTGSVVVFGLATILFGVSRLYAVIFFALALAGAANSVSTIIRNTIRNLNTPNSFRGRMTGVNQIFFMGGPQLGEVEAGAAAQAFGVPFAIYSGGIGVILIVVLIAARWPSLLHYNGDEPSVAGAPAEASPRIPRASPRQIPCGPVHTPSQILASHPRSSNGAHHSPPVQPPPFRRPASTRRSLVCTYALHKSSCELVVMPPAFEIGHLTLSPTFSPHEFCASRLPRCRRPPH